MSDVFGLCDTKFDECINAHFGGEMLFVVAGVELFFGWQVSIEVFDESGEKREEGFVEMLVELVQCFLDELVGFDDVEQLFWVIGECGASQCFLVLRHGLNDVGAFGHVACNVGISDAIGDGELCVECGELCIE